jgi:cell shape-determining protein MreC
VPVYSAGRRRTIALLLLTSVLLLTIDLRGNAAFDAVRSGFMYVFSPFESAAEVVTQPITNAWRGITDYDELVDENQRLQEQIDAQRGAEIAARNAIVENQQLLALNELDALSNLPTVTCQVIGESPSNQYQQVEIDCGDDRAVDVGMAIVNEAGLVGKVTRVYGESSLVMLVTDPQYAVPVKVLSVQEPQAPETTPTETVPSGLAVEDVTTTTTTTTVPTTTTQVPIVGASPIPTTTVASTVPPGTSVPSSSPPDATSPGDTSLDATSTSTTSTTVAPVVADIETGVLEGRGANRLPHVSFIADNPRLGRPKVGDTIHTTGGRLSLAPPDIPVGVVANVVPSRGSAGSILEVELSADLSRLQFVRVVLYKPPIEVGG